VAESDAESESEFEAGVESEAKAEAGIESVAKFEAGLGSEAELEEPCATCICCCARLEVMLDRACHRNSGPVFMALILCAKAMTLRVRRALLRLITVCVGGVI